MFLSEVETVDFQRDNRENDSNPGFVFFMSFEISKYGSAPSARFECTQSF